MPCDGDLAPCSRIRRSVLSLCNRFVDCERQELVLSQRDPPMNFLVLPTYEQPLTKGGQTASVWYRAFQGLVQGVPPSAERTITVGISPFSYTAPSKGFLIISGGIVTATQFTRTVTTLTGQTTGIYPLSQGDVLTVTYTGLPTVTWVPQ
jgi:hypothetical protein